MKKFTLLAALTLFSIITFGAWFRWQQYKKSSSNSDSDAAIGKTEIIDISKKICTDNIGNDAEYILNKLNITLVFKCNNLSEYLGQLGIINNNKNRFIEVEIDNNSYLYDKYLPSLKDQLGLTKRNSLFNFIPIANKSSMVIKIKVLPVENSIKRFRITTSSVMKCNSYIKTVWSIDIKNYCDAQGVDRIEFVNWSDVTFKLTGEQGETFMLGNETNTNKVPNISYLEYNKLADYYIEITTVPNK